MKRIIKKPLLRVAVELSVCRPAIASVLIFNRCHFIRLIPIRNFATIIILSDMLILFQISTFHDGPYDR